MEHSDPGLAVRVWRGPRCDHCDYELAVEVEEEEVEEEEAEGEEEDEEQTSWQGGE